MAAEYGLSVSFIRVSLLRRKLVPCVKPYKAATRVFVQRLLLHFFSRLLGCDARSGSHSCRSFSWIPRLGKADLLTYDGVIVILPAGFSRVNEIPAAQDWEYSMANPISTKNPLQKPDATELLKEIDNLFSEFLWHVLVTHS